MNEVYGKAKREEECSSGCKAGEEYEIGQNESECLGHVGEVLPLRTDDFEKRCLIEVGLCNVSDFRDRMFEKRM